MQPNQHKTKSFKRFAVKWLKRFITVLTLSVIAYVIAIVYSNYHPVIVTKEIIKDTSPAMFAQKIDSLEKSVVEAVRKCESQGANESTGLIVFDSNKVASIGTLQFQVKTVVYYYKTLYSKVITGKEAIIIALDDKLSGQLAQDIMFSSKSLANDWLNCSNRLSLEAQILAIKKIK